MPFGMVMQLVIVVTALGLLTVTTALTAHLLLANRRPLLVGILVVAMTSVVGGVVAISQDTFCRSRVHTAGGASSSAACAFHLNLTEALGGLLRRENASIRRASLKDFETYQPIGTTGGGCLKDGSNSGFPPATPAGVSPVHS